MPTPRYVSAGVVSAPWIGVIILCFSPFLKIPIPRFCSFFSVRSKCSSRFFTIGAPSFCGLAGNVLQFNLFRKTFLFETSWTWSKAVEWKGYKIFSAGYHIFGRVKKRPCIGHLCPALTYPIVMSVLLKHLGGSYLYWTHSLWLCSCSCCTHV